MDLFEPFLPNTWLPGETLFSWCSRYHAITGHVRHEDTCLALFGHRRYGSAHDVPSRVAEFASKHQGTMGSAVEIICQRTILPFYFPFAKPESKDKAIATLSGDGVDRIKHLLSFDTRRFSSKHPLKACPMCICEDRSLHGVPYWHLEHQLPGVWICLKHDELLLASDIKATRAGRYEWVLPDHANLAATGGKSVSTAARRLASASANLWGMTSHSRLSLSAVAAAYRESLEEKGIFYGGRLDRAKSAPMVTDFLMHSQLLSCFTDMKSLPSTSSKAAMEIEALAEEKSNQVHPLRHLALITWLYGSFEEFLA